MNKVILDLAHSFHWGYIINPKILATVFGFDKFKETYFWIEMPCIYYLVQQSIILVS